MEPRRFQPCLLLTLERKGPNRSGGSSSEAGFSTGSILATEESTYDRGTSPHSGSSSTDVRVEQSASPDEGWLLVVVTYEDRVPKSQKGSVMTTFLSDQAAKLAGAVKGRSRSEQVSVRNSVQLSWID
jgi:hypothetical protein